MNLSHEVYKTRVHRAVIYPTIYTIAPNHLHARTPIVLVLVTLLLHEYPFYIAVACTEVIHC